MVFLICGMCTTSGTRRFFMRCAGSFPKPIPVVSYHYDLHACLGIRTSWIIVSHHMLQDSLQLGLSLLSHFNWTWALHHTTINESSISRFTDGREQLTPLTCFIVPTSAFLVCTPQAIRKHENLFQDGHKQEGNTSAVITRAIKYNTITEATIRRKRIGLRNHRAGTQDKSCHT